MKRLYLFLLFLYLFVYNIFAKDFTSFLGIPFGTSEIETCKTMKEKGWIITDRLDFNDSVVIYFEGNTYAGKDVDFITLDFDHDHFNQASINFVDIYNVQKIVEAIVNKYDLKYLGTMSYYSSEDQIFLFYDEDYINISCSKFNYIPELDMSEVEKDI